jgi:hypothetical protein
VLHLPQLREKFKTFLLEFYEKKIPQAYKANKPQGQQILESTRIFLTSLIDNSRNQYKKVIVCIYFYCSTRSYLAAGNIENAL